MTIKSIFVFLYRCAVNKFSTSMEGHSMETREVSAIDIAWHIISFIAECGDCITHLKLQKLLYYAQAWHLVNFDKVLFNEQIEAWQYGPVVRSVYEEFSCYGYKPIELEKMPSKYIQLNAEQSEYIKEFCTYFMKYSATELVTMTHNESPWVEAFAKGKSSVISIDSMKEFYSNIA